MIRVPTLLADLNSWPKFAPDDALELVVRQTDDLQDLEAIAHALAANPDRAFVTILPPLFDKARDGFLPTPKLTRKVPFLLLYELEDIVAELSREVR